jgi:hypothetical protein
VFRLVRSIRLKTSLRLSPDFSGLSPDAMLARLEFNSSGFRLPDLLIRINFVSKIPNLNRI